MIFIFLINSLYFIVYILATFLFLNSKFLFKLYYNSLFLATYYLSRRSLYSVLWQKRSLFSCLMLWVQSQRPWSSLPFNSFVVLHNNLISPLIVSCPSLIGRPRLFKSRKLWQRASEAGSASVCLFETQPCAASYSSLFIYYYLQYPCRWAGI